VKEDDEAAAETSCFGLTFSFHSPGGLIKAALPAALPLGLAMAKICFFGYLEIPVL
jgi:hypothetical protein